MITVYAPQFVVRLHKTISRRTTNGSDAVSRRFAGAASRLVIDLADFLGDGAGVFTTKSISDPAGGFTVRLIDRPDGNDGTFESLYGLIEPMDMIEIRARHGAPTDAGEPPIIMRGFVSTVQRTEAVDNDGKPTRAVMIMGHDYGKIWQVIQINYLADYLIGKQYISGFPLFEKYGISNNVLSAAEFVQQVVDKIINPYMDGLMPSASLLPRQMTADISVPESTVSPGVQAHQGTIYEMLRYYGDVGPWNELYTEDREDTVALVYRAAPFLKTDGTDGKVQAEAPDPVYIDIPTRDIVERNLARSDANVANFFWVSSQRFNLVYETQRQQEALANDKETVDISAYPNADAKLYGIRLMQLSTEQGGAAMGTHDSGRAESDFNQLGSEAVKWMDKRRQAVVDANRDNIVLESGRITLRGNEAIKPGVYIRFTSGALVSTYYVKRVDHRMVPFQAFVTDVEVERGTGFIARVLQAGSPYFEEQQ